MQTRSVASQAGGSGRAERRRRRTRQDPRLPADNDDLLVRAGRGWQDGVVGHVRLVCNPATPAGRTFLTGQSVAIDNIRQEPHVHYVELLQSHGVISLLDAPIRMGGFNYGVLASDGTRVTAWTSDDL